RRAWGSVQQAGRYVHHYPARLGGDHEPEWHQAAAVEDEEVAGRVGLHGVHPAQFGAGGVDHGRPDELVHPQPVVGGGQRLGAQDRAPQFVGLLPGVDAGEGHDPAPLEGRGALDGEVAALGGEDRAGVDPLGAIGDEVDHHLALEAVGLGDAPHLEHRQSTMSTLASMPSRAPAARTTVRMAWATRPRLPMILPMSSGATWRRSATRPRLSLTSTTTASGSSTIWRATYSRTERDSAPAARLASPSSYSTSSVSSRSVSSRSVSSRSVSSRSSTLVSSASLTWPRRRRP